MELYEPGDLSDGAVEAVTRQMLGADSQLATGLSWRLKFISDRPPELDKALSGTNKSAYRRDNNLNALIDISISLPLWLVIELEEIAVERGKEVDEVIIEMMGDKTNLAVPSWVIGLRGKLGISLPGGGI